MFRCRNKSKIARTHSKKAVLFRTGVFLIQNKGKKFRKFSVFSRKQGFLPINDVEIRTENGVSFNFTNLSTMTKTRRLAFCLGIFLIFVHCAGHFENRVPLPKMRAELGAVRSFAVIYKKVPLGELTPFDLLILDPDAYTRADFEELKAEGKILLGYLNVGEVESYRWYAGQVPKKWLLGVNPKWPEHRFVNVKKRGWRKLLIRKVAPRIFQRGADGLFLDSVDLASPGRRPKLRGAMVRLIRELHQKFPEKFLVLNNGQFLLRDVAEATSALAVENVFTKSDENGRVLRPAGEVSDILQNLQNLKKQFQLPVFVVDYLPPEGRTVVEDWYAIAHRYGLKLYVGDAFLQHVSTVLLPENYSKERHGLP